MVRLIARRRCGARRTLVQREAVPLLATELMKARLALLLGKTYVQEQPLRWGYLTPPREDTPRRRVRIEGRRKTREA